MKTCARCGVVSPDSATRCDCGAELRPEEVARALEGTVAGFWIRLGADLLDAIVLGVVGWVLTLFFREPFARLFLLEQRGVGDHDDLDVAAAMLLQKLGGHAAGLGKVRVGRRLAIP